MEHRDSPEIEPESASEGRRFRSGRGFAKLVESPVSRRVALPRLIVASGLALSLTTLMAVGITKLLRSAADWVARRPEHQIRFDQIELSPEPDPWVRDGKPQILEEVREGAKLGEALSLLDLDLAELQKDFQRCAWVKDVPRIDRSHHGRLIVELVYRKPLAVVVLGKSNPRAFPIDDEAVALPIDDIVWSSTKPPFRVHGIADPLIEIRGVLDDTPPQFGCDWKKPGSDDRDLVVLQAARLAEFLGKQGRATPRGNIVAQFAEIRLPIEPDHPFLLVDSAQNRISWGKAPGLEKSGESSSEARWKMLLDWVDRNGPLNAKAPGYLFFTRSRAELFDGRSDRKPPR